MEGIEIELNGAYLRYLIAFKDNYFGQWTSHVSSEEFAAAGNRSVSLASLCPGCGPSPDPLSLFWCAQQSQELSRLRQVHGRKPNA
jgi:hypothetical protein